MGECILISDCPECNHVGAHMYFDGTATWCGVCHAQVEWIRR
nr:MAG TPA: ArsC family reductase [Caudoviricetes sp.]